MAFDRIALSLGDDTLVEILTQPLATIPAHASAAIPICPLALTSIPPQSKGSEQSKGSKSKGSETLVFSISYRFWIALSRQW